MISLLSQCVAQHDLVSHNNFLCSLAVYPDLSLVETFDWLSRTTHPV